MQAKVRTVAFQGVDVLPVDVQVMIAPGTVAFAMVGLADKAVGESRERVRAALRALGLALPPQRISVNLSPAQFNGPDLAAIVAAALADSGLAPSRLTLEITESVLLKDDDVSMAMLHRLRDLGVSIALDDFGTGYSSLSYLRSFPFSQLKIDQSFVRDLPKRSECVAIVQAITSLARSLDMTTVAEGVETNDHLQRVRAAGCDQAQGYLFSKPVPVERIPAIIEECQLRALFAA